MGEDAEKMGRGPLWAASLCLGALLCAVVGYLQWRAVFQGYTQSFDAMIYIRSLWGMAHGDLHNSVREVPSLTIHNNLLLFALAPLARALHPGLVLVAGQALSLGAAASLLSYRFGLTWQRHQPERAAQAPAWGLWAALSLTLGAPLVLNPFFYDLHPEVMGLPWMLAGLLRAIDQGHFDKKALLWTLPAVLLREEYALMLGAAVFLAPGGAHGGPWWSSWKGRFTAALAAGAWFTLYYILAALAGEVWSTAALKFSGGEPGEPLELLGFLHSKLILLAAVALSAGGLWWRGWRWAGVLAPGMAFLLINQHMAQQQVRFHYGFLVSAGLCAASYAAWKTWTKNQTKHHTWVQPALWTALALLGFAVFSAAPGGGQFWASAYDMQDGEGGVRWDLGQHGPARGVHQMLEQIPAQDAVAAPWSLGAPLSARQRVRVDLHIMEHMKAHGAPPPWLETLVLRRREWGNAGRFLTGAHGFRLAAIAHDTAILTRSPRMEGVRVGLEQISSELPPGSCEQPLGRWPSQGLVLCHVKQWPDGRWAVTVRRAEAGQGEARLDVLLRGPGGASPVWLLRGMMGAEGLPVGAVAAFVSQEPLPWRPTQVMLAPPGGQPVQAQGPSGAASDALPLDPQRRGR